MLRPLIISSRGLLPSCFLRCLIAVLPYMLRRPPRLGQFAFSRSGSRSPNVGSEHKQEGNSHSTETRDGKTLSTSVVGNHLVVFVSHICTKRCTTKDLQNLPERSTRSQQLLEAPSHCEKCMIVYGSEDIVYGEKARKRQDKT